MSERRLPGAGGVDLAVRTWEPPAGTGFVLVHGLASNARMWDGVADALATAGHPVAALDQRGHGRSARPDEGYDFATVTADLAAVIEALGWDRPVVVGQSWGGNVVLDLAAHRPNLVGGVACIDGGWIELSRHYESWESCAAALAPPDTVGRPADDVRAMLRSLHPAWPDAGIEGFMANFEVRADGTVAPWLTGPRHMAVLRALWEHRPSALFGRVSVPALLVPALGATGRGMGADAATEAAAAIPRARLAGLAGDHDLHAQRPDDVADLLLAWADDEVAG